MAITQEQIDALESAIVAGELTVQNGDERVTYESKDALIKAHNWAVQQYKAQNSSTSSNGPRCSVATFSD